MAISASAVWEVRTTGSDSNGGFYVSGGADYSQSDTPILGLTDVVTSGTTTVTSATGGFTSAMIGNGFNIAGTVYQITAVNSLTSVTVDRAATSGTGQAGKVGGALASLGKAAGLTVDGNTVWQRSGTYPITSTSSNVSGGRVLVVSGVNVVGYGSARGDYTTRPVNQASGISATTVIQFNNPCERAVVDFVGVDGASLTSVKGFANAGGSATECHFVRCLALNCTNGGFSATQINMSCVLCIATGCSVAAAFSCTAPCFYCVATANTASGFGASGAIGPMVGCVSYANTGASSHGFFFNNASSYAVGCVAYGNGGSGFASSGGSAKGFVVQNCVAYGNSAYGYDSQTSDKGVMAASAAGGNATANVHNASSFYTVAGLVTLTADPFTNAAAGDFSLNNVAGGGRLLRGAGFPGAFPGGLTTGYPDIGAAQHRDAGGGLIPVGMGGGIG